MGNFERSPSWIPTNWASIDLSVFLFLIRNWLLQSFYISNRLKQAGDLEYFDVYLKTWYYVLFLQIQYYVGDWSSYLDNLKNSWYAIKWKGWEVGNGDSNYTFKKALSLHLPPLVPKWNASFRGQEVPKQRKYFNAIISNYFSKCLQNNYSHQ